MNELGVFLYESGISLSVLYLFYWLLLRKETWFLLNRIILISTLLLSLAIPFIRITLTGNSEQGSIIYVFSRYIMDPLVITPETAHAKQIQSISMLQIIYFIYFTGVIFFTIKLFVQFFQIFNLVKKYGTRKLSGYKIVPIDKDLSPFSFFNYIFINTDKKNNNELKKVLHHEGEHSARLHTIDIILFEIICIIQWFNPFIWLYKLSLREVHEYEADLRVIKNGENKLSYQKLILQQVFGNQFFQVAHYLFTNSLIKKRITMMTKIESKRRTIIKSLLILPIAAILVTIFSCTQKDDLKQDIMDENKSLEQTDRFNDNLEGEVFFIVEEMPKFSYDTLENLKAFRKYVADNLTYPEEAAEKGIEGDVFVQFIVNKKGQVVNAVIMRSLDPLLDEEVLRVINSSPKWTPGKQRGHKVNVAYTMPVKFKLSETEKKGKITGEIFYIVEEMPDFQGKGLDSFRDWVMENLNYPEKAAEQGIEGTVYIQFVVNKDGNISNTKIMRSVDPLLDAEAIRVVKSSPEWTPGKQKGHEVNVAFTFPIKFVLQ